MTEPASRRKAAATRPGPDHAREFVLDAHQDAMCNGQLNGFSFDPRDAALLIELLSRLKWMPAMRDLAVALPHFPRVFGPHELRTTLANLGYASSQSRRRGSAISQRGDVCMVVDGDGVPWLLDQEEGRACLSHPRGRDGMAERQPIRPHRTYDMITFREMRHDADADRAVMARGSYMADLFSRFAPQVRLLFLLSVLTGAMAIIVAFGITMIFDTVLPTRNTTTLLHILFGLGLVFGVDFALRRIKTKLIGRISARVENILGADLFGKLLRLRPNLVTAAPVSAQLARLRQFEAIRDVPASPMVATLLELPLTVILLTTIAFMAWPLAAMLFVLCVAFGLAGLVAGPGLKRETRKLAIVKSGVSRTVTEILANRQHIARYGLADALWTKTSPQIGDLVRQRRRVAIYARVIGGISYASLPFSAAMVIGVGAVLVMNGSVTQGQLVATTILTWRLMAPVQQLLVQMSRLQDVRDLAADVDAMMRLPNEESTRAAEVQRMPEGHLSASNVVVRFPKSVLPTLMDLHLDIPHGAFTTLIGASGSGKSTLLKVFAGLLPPNAGAVHLNQLNIAQLSKEFRVANIAYVPQQPPFFFGSVAQNLRFADPGASDERLHQVLADLGMTEWLNDLPEGLSTRLDPSRDSAILRPGVKSMLAVARAFLTDPVVLCLDEPAGGLDRHLESNLLSALKVRQDRMTTIMVTHRPSIIRQADLVIALNSRKARVYRQNDSEQAA
ncbi:peptidase domain-containing ABC transporter [Roseobacter sp. A03A-229]